MNESWDTLLSAYAQFQNAAGHSRSTRKLRMVYARMLADCMTKRPARVELDDLVAFLAEHPHWKPATRCAVTACLRNLFAWMQHSGRRTDNPAARLPKVRAPRGVPRPCPDELVRRAMAVSAPRELLMIRLGSEAGLRCAEIASVRSDSVSRALYGHVLTVTGKGGKTRTVPISDGLAAAIASRGDGWTFPGRTDGHLSPVHVGRLVAATLPEGWTCHTLRHRFASAAYCADRDIRAVQELLGHASVATTMIYTAVPDGAKRRAALAAAVAA